MSTEPYTPDEMVMREAHRLHARAVTDLRRREAGEDPMTDAEISAEFGRFKAQVEAEALRRFVESAKDLLDSSGDTRWKARALAYADEVAAGGSDDRLREAAWDAAADHLENRYEHESAFELRLANPWRMDEEQS